MQKILVIHSSLNQDEGNSAQLASHLGQHLASKYSAQLHSEHLYAQDLPHLTSNEMQAWMTSTDDRTQTQQELAAISDAYIAQVMTADTIVIGMPMYNFGVPSAFKAWIDRIARAGVTFKYTDQGPVGLLKDKKIIVVAARGGDVSRDTTRYTNQVFTRFLWIFRITRCRFYLCRRLSDAR